MSEAITIESLQAQISKLNDLQTTLIEIIEHQGLAMQAAVIEAEIGAGPESGLDWIRNTLFGPGLFPDLDEARELGGAQGFFDKHAPERGVKTDMVGKMMAPRVIQEPPMATEIDVHAAATHLAFRARAAGFIVRIDQQSEQPAAMGRHSDVVTVYVKRGTA